MYLQKVISRKTLSFKPGNPGKFQVYIMGLLEDFEGIVKIF